MKHKYNFTVAATISMQTTVYAEDLDSASEMAQEQSVMQLCYLCGCEHRGVWSTLGEFDCCPSDSELVDCTEDGVTVPLHKVVW